MAAIKKVVVVVIFLLIAVVIISAFAQKSTPFEGWTKKYGVFSINSDGSGMKLIYQSDTQLNHLHISPDGTKILFSEFTQDLNGDGTASEDDLFSAEIGVMSIDGTGYRLLTNNNLIIDAVPVWSPDGTELLFASSRGSTAENLNLDLYIMDLAGENIRRLTTTDEVIEADPHWVGNKIAFARLVKGENYQAIWLMNSDGTENTQLTFPPSPGKSETGYNFGDFDPKIYGTRVAFSRHLDDNLIISNRTIGNYDLFVINTDGTGETRLTSTSDVIEWIPTWSPDGTKLAFTVLREGGFYLRVINADGTGEREVAIALGAPAGATMPDWFPDGQKLIFSAARY